MLRVKHVHLLQYLVMCDSWYIQVHMNTGNECSPTVTQDLIAALDGTE